MNNKMKHFVNKSQYPTDLVLPLVEYAIGDVDLSQTYVRVVDCDRAWNGSAAWNTDSKHFADANVLGAKYAVELGIGAPHSFPDDNLQDYRMEKVVEKPFDNLSDREAMLYEIAVSMGMCHCVVRDDDTFIAYCAKPLPEGVQEAYGGPESVRIDVPDWQTCIVKLAAHEFGHIDDYNHGVTKEPNEAKQERRAKEFLDSYLADRVRNK